MSNTMIPTDEEFIIDELDGVDEPQMIHLARAWTDEEKTLCGKRIVEYRDDDEPLDCVVCADIARSEEGFEE